MRILQINRNFSSGGAAIAAYRLHSYINQKTDSQSYIYCRYLYPNNTSENVKQFYQGLTGRILSLYIDGIEKISGRQYFYQKSFQCIADDEWFKSADVVHFHITHGGYINQWFIAEVAKYKPVVWTLHDMWAITGRCAHSNDCEKWKTGCGYCPYKKRYPATWIDTSAYLWKLKKKIYENMKISIVTPSAWLNKKLPDSILKHCDARVIANAVDTGIFRPYEKYSVRKELGLPADRTIFLFVAHGGIFNTYKGFPYLRRALKELYKKQLSPFLIIIGGTQNISLNSLGLEGIFIKTISDDSLMAKYYSAADCLVCSSTQENAPLTIIESLTCQTPVLAFRVGGIPEMIEHKKTGYLAESINEHELAQGMEWIMLMGRREYDSMARKCGQIAAQKYSLENQAQNYLNLYKNIMV